MLTILTLKMLLMIVYLAHWDWILTQSRKELFQILMTQNLWQFAQLMKIN
ncbi:MAG: hypothetical protein Ct9H90mP17_3630 [Actinomycetota bacterium]|nr:MAG: hypothetical protein Ct9H90mP17_3630 [Actinomycetota bacterium]